jgi:hypothetical protein
MNHAMNERLNHFVGFALATCRVRQHRALEANHSSALNQRRTGFDPTNK